MTTYTKTNWVDNTTNLTAANLNNIDLGVYNAHQEVPVTTGFIAAFSSVPTGWLECNGAGLDTTAYATLFGVLQYNWGGTGSTFNIPDLRGRFIRVWDAGAGNDSGRAFSTYQADDNKAHNHTLTDDYVYTTGGSNQPTSWGSCPRGDTAPTVSVAAEGSTEGKPVNMCLYYCIKY